MITKEEVIRRWEVQNAFENDTKIQYRKLGNTDWKDAYWCDFKWSEYDYRIKPEEKERAYPLRCFMDEDGLIIWTSGTPYLSWREVKRFTTVNKVRHAVV